MDTEIIKIGAGASVADVAARAADVLRGGGLVAFPTETVYGLGARADDAGAMQRLRAVKSRQGHQAFTVHVGRADDLRRFVPNPGSLGERLARKGWPGPMTLIFPVSDPESVPVLAGLDGSARAAIYFENSVGLRCPDDACAQAILTGVGAPVVAASANPAGLPPPQTAAAVLAELSGSIDLLVDAGGTRYAKASTIVRIDGEGYSVTREGVYDAGIVKRLASMHILLVCTGNTCRSPMAEGLAKRLLAKRLGCATGELPSRGVHVRSAGTFGGGGARASEFAIDVMSRRGIDVSDHVSVGLTNELVERADYIFAMTGSHRSAILSIAPSSVDRVALLIDNRDVVDPVGGSVEDYEACAKVLETGLIARIAEITA